ncbi:hypothetical protein MP11Mi_19200 [Gordonia sp. MP11Mi]|uniref:HTH araC/xylS-type domain-containing protein n=2 Tax=Gordonia sp. MP11Mi TaxID=3022769 RepID=A0AA97CXS1_9ACTN
MDLVFDGDSVSVAGADTGPRHVSRPSATDVSGVRFTPGLLPVILGVPADELTDLTVPLADVAPAVARRVRCPADARAEIESATTLSWVGPTVRALSSGASARETADYLGISERHLHRRCVAAFGYGPRRLQVILRVGHAIDLLRAGAALADTAADAGYADYPHLYRDVVRLTGLRPAAFGSR